MVMKMTYFEYIWVLIFFVFFFSSRRRHTRSKRDWSSDVCSSDLGHAPLSRAAKRRAHDGAQRRIRIGVRHDEQDVLGAAARLHPFPVLAAERVDMEIGRASCRERVEISVGAGDGEKKRDEHIAVE